MNHRWLVGSCLGLAMGAVSACGGDDNDLGSSPNGGSAVDPASAGTGGDSASASGSPAGTDSAGSRNSGGASNGAGTGDDAGTSTSAGAGNSGGTRNGAGGVGAGGFDPGGVAGAGGSATTRPATFPLLVAATNDKVLVWQNADVAESDAPPSFELSVALGDKGAICGVVATRERLGVASSAGLFLFDELGKLSAASKPTAVIPPTAFSADLSSHLSHQFVDAQGDLWLTYGPGRVALLKGFNALKASSKPAAEFSHEWEQLTSAAYYAPGDILFGTQVSGAGLLYYSNAKTKTGVITPDGAFDSFTGWQSGILGDSLFAVWSSGLGVWHGLDTNRSPRSPDATRTDSGLYLDASADAVAIAGDSGTVSYFASASSLSSGSKPETLHVAPSLYGIDLSNDARSLATVGEHEVYVIDQGAGKLSLRATLPLGKAVGNDVVLVE